MYHSGDIGVVDGHLTLGLPLVVSGVEGETLVLILVPIEAANMPLGYVTLMRKVASDIQIGGQQSQTSVVEDFAHVYTVGFEMALKLVVDHGKRKVGLTLRGVKCALRLHVTPHSTCLAAIAHIAQTRHKGRKARRKQAQQVVVDSETLNNSIPTRLGAPRQYGAMGTQRGVGRSCQQLGVGLVGDNGV